MIDVLIADDHAVVRQGLNVILSKDESLRIVGEARDGHEVLRMAESLKPDVVILDITLPGKNGLDVLKELKRRYASLPVLILSMHPEDQFGIRILRAGAAGYLTKECAPEELIGAVRKICGGGKYVTTALAERLAVFVEQKKCNNPHDQLSDREYQILRMLALGKTVTQIADELCLSIKTVSTYRTRILDKMEMESNAELTAYALNNQLLT